MAGARKIYATGTILGKKRNKQTNSKENESGRKKL
jgi:hypothetical protein